MKAVIQRVKRASVTVNGAERRDTGAGLVVLLAVGLNDTETEARWLAEKTAALRIFPDERGKFDRSVLDTGGDILVVSQFTLYGDCTRGRRPDFTSAARPEQAVPLYERYVENLRKLAGTVKTGEFAADMLVDIQNDGPVTIIIDTADRQRQQP